MNYWPVQISLYIILMHLPDVQKEAREESE